jgi:hypothetical protein
MLLVITTNRRMFLGTLAAGLALRATPALSWPIAPPSRNALYEKLFKEYETLQSRFAEDVLALAAEVRALEMPADADAVAALADPPSQQSLRMDYLPDTLLPEISASLPKEERDWRLRLRGLESNYADDLFRLGERSKTNVQISLAWRLVREAAFRNPDHLRARAALGYVRYENTWTTPFRKQMLERGHVWHDQFGWILKEDLPRYLAGEQRAPDGRWVKAARAAAIRADFAFAWQVDSEHFHVRSNHSLERAVQISVDLERFHDYFVREFAAVFMTPQQMQKLFAGGPGIVNSKRHVVHYFRTRDEFRNQLIQKQPEAAYCDGLYMPEDRRAYFFDRPGQEDKVAETMYHEVTHQILSESARKPVVVNNWDDGDFWLVEGLACYLESFKPKHRGGMVGDPKHLRIDWARKFLVDEGFQIPLEKFCAMTQRDFQCADLPNGPARVDKLQHHYAQAAGVTHFFMHYQDGKYRDAFITYLSQIYSADQRIRRNNATLAELTDVSFQNLDSQYADYMRHLE